MLNKHSLHTSIGFVILNMNVISAVKNHQAIFSKKYINIYILQRSLYITYILLHVFVSMQKVVAQPSSPCYVPCSDTADCHGTSPDPLPSVYTVDRQEKNAKRTRDSIHNQSDCTHSTPIRLDSQASTPESLSSANCQIQESGCVLEQKCGISVKSKRKKRIVTLRSDSINFRKIKQVGLNLSSCQCIVYFQLRVILCFYNSTAIMPFIYREMFVYETILLLH